MIKFDAVYEGPSSFQGGNSNLELLGRSLSDYIKRNFSEETSVKKERIEGKGPGSRYIKIIFPIGNGNSTMQRVELHDDTQQERLKSELSDLYRKAEFCLENFS